MPAPPNNTKIFKSAVEQAAAPASGQRSTIVGPRQITGMSFDDKGDWLVTAAEDETFRVYNCKTGKQVFLLCEFFAL
ncbi:hypothetical protein H0H93_009865 [Arthromyces matolae]|nr:hypothetical protein H0H93_009865 [Arthromyces matolae]